MLQKVGASLPQLGAQPTVSSEHLAWATSQVNLFFGSFRKADADDPETFTAGCLRLFTAYPSEVVQYVVDPLTGLPGQSEWLPSLKLVKDALEKRDGEITRAVQRGQEIDKQLAARREWIASRANKPTLDEMKAMYGDNWGLKGDEDDKNKERRAARLAKLQEANQRVFAAECEAAGMPADSSISPALASLIRAGMA